MMEVGDLYFGSGACVEILLVKRNEAPPSAYVREIRDACVSFQKLFNIVAISQSRRCSSQIESHMVSDRRWVVRDKLLPQKHLFGFLVSVHVQW